MVEQPLGDRWVKYLYLDGAARGLVQLVRLPGGELQDDVGLVLLRADWR